MDFIKKRLDVVISLPLAVVLFVLMLVTSYKDMGQFRFDIRYVGSLIALFSVLEILILTVMEKKIKDLVPWVILLLSARLFSGSGWYEVISLSAIVITVLVLNVFVDKAGKKKTTKN